MPFEKLNSPSLKQLFVRQLQGMILPVNCPWAASFPRNGSWPARCR